MDTNKLPTLIVVVAGIVVLGVCVWQKADRETIGAIGAALVSIAGAMRGFVIGGAK